MNCPDPPPDWIAGLAPIDDEDLTGEPRPAVGESPMVLSGEALVVDPRVLGHKEGAPVLLVGLGEPTSPRVVDVETPPASTITSFEMAGRWFWQCECSAFCTGYGSREEMLQGAAAHVTSGRCPHYCDACGGRLRPGAWPFCVSERNPHGHERGHYSVKT